MRYKKIIKYLILIIVPLIIVGFVIYYFATKEKPSPYKFVLAERGTVREEVSVTGKVVSVDQVDLAFQKSGKVNKINIKVGNTAEAGDLLMSLADPVLNAQILRAKANVDSERATLTQLEKGTRQEELQLAKTKVANAENTLNDSVLNLNTVKEKAEVDLQNDYDTAITTAQKSMGIAKSAVILIAEIQYTYYSGVYDSEISALQNYQTDAVFYLLGASGGNWLPQYISPLTGGTYGEVQNAVNGSREDIEKALDNSLVALQKVLLALNKVKILNNFSTTDRSSLDSYKNSVSTEIYNITTSKQAIELQKAINTSAIVTAEASVNESQNALDLAKADLVLKEAGATPEQIASQRARVRSVEADVANLEAQYIDNLIYAPIKGVVSKIDIKQGEIASMNTPVITLISDVKYEIEANIPEADISIVAIDNMAQVTLDAYGSEEIFEAEVYFIDPAETIVDGVTTYKVKFRFLEEDERILSGMTANIDIVNRIQENVIAIPQRAVIRTEAGKIVRILEGKMVKEVMVQTGIRGVDGNIEILSGINEGDKVITFIEGEL